MRTSAPLAAFIGRMSVTLSVAAMGGLVVGCSTTGNFPPAPRASDAPTQRYDYRIGPLDTLNIVVWRNPEVSGVVTVRPDGFISTPLVDELLAQGRTPSELGRELEKSLARVLRDPVVSVVVTGFQGVYAEQVRIVGEAAKPQAVPFRQNMTVLDVMIQVGGITDFADGNSAVLIRGAEGGKQYSLRLKDLLRRGDISANAVIFPGDIIIVPQSWF